MFHVKHNQGEKQMPVVTMPLCSVDAVGTIARRHTFYPKAGKTILRQCVQGTNPSSAGQVQARAIHSLTTHMVKWAAATVQTSDGQATTDKQRIQALTPMARRWVNVLYSKALADGQANVRGAMNQWALLTPTEQAAWTAAAVALSPAIASWTPNTAPGAAAPTFTPGEIFFVWRYLLFLLRASNEPPTGAPAIYSA